MNDEADDDDDSKSLMTDSDKHNPDQEQKLYVPRPKGERDGVYPLSAPPWKVGGDFSLSSSPQLSQLSTSTDTARSSPVSVLRHYGSVGGGLNGVSCASEDGVRNAEPKEGRSQEVGQGRGEGGGPSRMIALGRTRGTEKLGDAQSQSFDSNSSNLHGIHQSSSKDHNKEPSGSNCDLVPPGSEYQHGDPIPAPGFDVPHFPYEPSMPAAAQTPVESIGYHDLSANTSHAPPPSYQSYANDLSLEQHGHQRPISCSDHLHNHLDAAVNQLSKSFKETSNRSTARMTRQVDAMVSLCGLIHAKTTSQAETARQMKQVEGDIQDQVESLRRETRLMEQRLLENLDREMGEVKAQLGRLSVPGIGVSHAERRMTTDMVGNGNGEYEEGLGEQEILKKDEASTENSAGQASEGDEKRHEHHTSSTGRSECVRQTICSETVPTPTAGFRTPEGEIGRQAKQGDPRPEGRPRRTFLNPSEESCGSPTPRAAKPKSIQFHHSGATLTANSLSNPTQTSDNNNEQGSEDKNNNNKRELARKTPRKTGMFKFRRKHDGGNHQNRLLRTPRRDREARVDDDKDTAASSSTATPSIIPRLPEATTDRSETASHGEGEGKGEDISPSNVHPALRTARQQQQMREREREREQRSQLPPKPPSPNPTNIDRQTNSSKPSLSRNNHTAGFGPSIVDCNHPSGVNGYPNPNPSNSTPRGMSSHVLPPPRALHPPAHPVGFNPSSSSMACPPPGSFNVPNPTSRINASGLKSGELIQTAQMPGLSQVPPPFSANERNGADWRHEDQHRQGYRLGSPGFGNDKEVSFGLWQF